MKRFRTYRLTQEIRDKYADVSINVKDFIYPYFVVEGEGVKEEIATMPGICRFSIDTLVEDVKEVYVDIRKSDYQPLCIRVLEDKDWQRVSILDFKGNLHLGDDFFTRGVRHHRCLPL